MSQAFFPFILTDPAGRKHECEYVFDLDEDRNPWCCSLWINDVCVDGDMYDFMRIWDRLKAAQKEDEGDAMAWHRRAA